MIEVFKKVFNLDFYGQSVPPVNPPAGSARMFYDSATDEMVVVDSTGKNLIGSGTFAGTRVIVDQNLASILDFYGQQASPENPSTGLARAYYDSTTDDFAVIDSEGDVLLGTGSALSGREIEVSSKVQIIDFLGLPGAPSNPPAGFARMYYDSNADTFNVIDSTGKSLLSQAPPPVTIAFIAQTQTIQNQNSAAIDTTGATLIVAVTRANGTMGQMSDSAGNTWTYGTNIQSGSSSCQLRIAYVSLPTTSATHTFHIINNETSCEIFVFKGNSGGWQLDTQAGGFEGATPFTYANFLAGASPAVVVVGCGSNEAIVTGAINQGFSTPLMQNLSVSPEVGGSSYLIQSAAATVNPTWTLSQNNDWMAVIVSFVAA